MQESSHIMVKLVSGEILISRLDSITENEFILEYPMILNYSYELYSGKNQIYLTTLNPFNFLSELFTLNIKHVMIRFELEEDILAFYEKNILKKLNKSNGHEYESEEDKLYSFEITSNTSINWGSNGKNALRR